MNETHKARSFMINSQPLKPPPVKRPAVAANLLYIVNWRRPKSEEEPMFFEWSQWPGLNRRPTVYETVALPLSYIGLSNVEN